VQRVKFTIASSSIFLGPRPVGWALFTSFVLLFLCLVSLLAFSFCSTYSYQPPWLFITLSMPTYFIGMGCTGKEQPVVLDRRNCPLLLMIQYSPGLIRYTVLGTQLDRPVVLPMPLFSFLLDSQVVIPLDQNCCLWKYCLNFRDWMGRGQSLLRTFGFTLAHRKKTLCRTASWIVLPFNTPRI